MTISSSTTRVSYAGNGSTTEFSFPHRFLNESDLIVIVTDDTTGVETTQTLNTHYTVDGEGDANGGSITFLNDAEGNSFTPASGETLVITNNPDILQPYDPADGSALSTNAMERAFDKLTLIAQRTRDLVTRSFKLPDGDTSGASLEIPSPTALNLMRWDSAGTALENTELTDASAVAVAEDRILGRLAGEDLKDLTQEEVRQLLNAATEDRANTFKETQVIEDDTPVLRLNNTATTDLNLYFVLAGGALSLQHRNDDGTLSKTITTFDLAAGNIDLAAGGRLRAGSGFQGTPGFSFKDDPDTGIYRPSEDVVRVTTGGAWALEVGAGVLARGATGGDQGTGTINAEGVYDDGNLLTDYVFDAGIDGAVDTVKWDAEVPNRERVVEEADPETGKPERTQVEERTHEPAREFDLTETDPAAFAAKWRAERKLPAMKRLSDRVAARGGEKLGIGESLQALMETCEAQAVHIEKLRQEIEALRRVAVESSFEGPEK